MAITITSEPEAISTPYRPTFIDCSSDLGTIVRMIADVYVRGSRVTTIDKSPELGTTDSFRFEIGEVLQKELESEFTAASTIIDFNDDVLSSANYYVRLFEVYTSGSVFDTSWTEDGTGVGYEQSTTKNTFNGVNQHLQDIDDYKIADSTKKFLTNRPNLTKIPNNYDFMLSVMGVPSQVNFRIVEKDALNGGGSTVATNTTGATLNTYGKATMSTDPSLYDATTKSIVVTALNSGGTDVSESLTFNLYAPCDETVVYWQNHWGGFDTYSFEGKRREKTKTRTKSIQNRLTLDYNSYDRGSRDLTKDNTRETEIWTITENKDTIAWIAEVGESVDVFIIEDGERIPVNVKSVSSTIENSDRVVHQINIKYTLSNKRINQIG